MTNVGPVHTLIVYDVGTGNSEFSDYEIVHPTECKATYDKIMKCEWYDCAVVLNTNNAGVKFCLEYSHTPITNPGEYKIQAWAETFHGYDYIDYDGGIQLVTE